MKKYFLGVGLAAVMLGTFTSVHAVTIDELQAQIQVLLTQIKALQQNQRTSGDTTSGGSVATTNSISATSQLTCAFNQNLGFGLLNSEDVRQLQDVLRARGYLSGNSTGNFFTFTFEAVKKFQAANGIETTGFVGPQTRAALSRNCGTIETNSVSNSEDSATPPNIPDTKPGVPSASITANYASGVYSAVSGSEVILRWTYKNANGCDTDWGYGGYKDSDTIYPTSARIYSVTCYESPNRSGRTATAKVAVGIITPNIPSGLSAPTITADRSVIQSGDVINLKIGKYPSNAYQWSLIVSCPSGVLLSGGKADSCLAKDGLVTTYSNASGYTSQTTYGTSITNTSNSAQTALFTINASDVNGNLLGSNSVKITIYPGTTVSPTTPVDLKVVSNIGGNSGSLVSASIAAYPTNNNVSYWKLNMGCGAGVSILDYNQNNVCGMEYRYDRANMYNITVSDYPVITSFGLINNSSSQENAVLALTAYDSNGNNIGGDKEGIVLSGATQVVDLKVNGSDGPVSVTQGSTVNLSWTSAGNVSSCVTSGKNTNYWSSSSIFTNGSQVSLPITQSDSINIFCQAQGPVGVFQPVFDSVIVNVGASSGANVYSALQGLLQELSKTLGN